MGPRRYRGDKNPKATDGGPIHVRLAFGRDYADVAPVDGVIMASASHTLRVSVDVAPVT